ncbi:hypothetical protein B0H12DRAFT_1093419 [Mycena haematopus]|nr:hypothetical protein B0H12DRAFT_1093419 [Mycena haematopus]
MSWHSAPFPYLRLHSVHKQLGLAGGRLLGVVAYNATVNIINTLVVVDVLTSFRTRRLT